MRTLKLLLGEPKGCYRPEQAGGTRQLKYKIIYVGVIFIANLST